MLTARSRLVLTIHATVAIVAVGGFAGERRLSAAPKVPPISWSPCHRDLGLPFECGQVQVPLDHDDPGGAAISVAVVRLPASDPARRIGSLFLNPGGPGGSGVNFTLFAAPFLFSGEVAARFDLVGFDPRGIARSTALRCFGTPRQWAPYFTPFAFPVSTEEEALWAAGDRFLADACAQRGSRMMDHMATADVARDLDLLREAVGDEQLSFVGYSYGSYLGVTYANLFPDNVRALVVDGVLDPIAWSTGAPGEGSTVPFSTRLRSDAGAQATLEEFFRLCDAGGPRCAFAGGAAGRFAALAARLQVEPIPIVNPTTGVIVLFDYSALIANALGAMYDSLAWPGFAGLLAFLEARADPATLGVALGALWEQAGFITKRGFPNYPNAVEGFPGVACSDSINPASHAAWSAAADASEALFGYFGRIWTWISSPCAVWPGADGDRYLGPFNRSTRNPVLVVGTTFDPATRYEGAVTVSTLMPNASLLTVQGWAHTSLLLSQCADQAVAGYLLTTVPPPFGTACAQDVVPFTPASSVAAGPAGQLAARRFFRSNLVPETARPDRLR
jgi:pimeloyl-ACP methyl ester carboxylesterase